MSEIEYIIIAVAAIALYLYYVIAVDPGSNLITIKTKWGENLDPNNILQEYPRPQFVRSSYLNLNGYWDYAITSNSTEPTKRDGRILVPFCLESPLSGVEKQLLPGKALWYKRKIDLTKIENNGRFILHFDAVDQITEVFINGRKIGEHGGGYTAFSFDITEYVEDFPLNNVDLVVKVIDNLNKDGDAYGKQSKVRGNIWYIATSGIWLTVWVESVPKIYIKDVKILPKFDEHSVSFIPEIIGGESDGTVVVKDNEDIIIATGDLVNGKETILELPPDFEQWSPENPYLYKVVYTYGEDNVNSYFAMRKYSLGEDSSGLKRLFLNNKPYFQIGLLDQGYWSDGYYTPPSDEALIYDIQTMKDLGYNMLRKHIKIEPMRWYYYCDKIGMLVWQDQVSGGYPYNPMVIQFLPGLGIDLSDDLYLYFGRDSEKSRQKYYRDLDLMINQLYNVPSICTWVPFNEGWGQFDALIAVDFIKERDTSRFIDHASGWHDQYGGDFKSHHIYFREVEISPDTHNRAVVLSEFGGYSLAIKNHVGSDHQFGYEIYYSIDEFNKAYKSLIEDQIVHNIANGLSAIVYTQVSDVEDEVNGLLTYDRKVCKANKEIFKEVHSKLKY